MAGWKTALFSLQSGYCACCGKEIALSVAPGLPTFNVPLCGTACLDEWRWRETLSIMGKDYHVRER